ncbi:MAG: tetratricopeptide repeat protein, partial [Actinomycetota bacterium]|jgi:tetratricopeptide (TPR) repeat protein|nr:tetratricopeptide repeat protein [Actinomycetota bacterium]
MQEGNYEAAEPVLRQAVESLRGTYTSSDRAEAYANYNLGYTLLRLGRCEEALPYLNRSERLQGHREEIDAAQAEAQACLANGGQGTG